MKSLVPIFGSVFLISCLLLGDRNKVDAAKGQESSDYLHIPAGFPDVEFPTDNAFTPLRWELGKRLFYDPVLSIDSSISCASCHLPQKGFSDQRAFSPGVFGRDGVRNAPSLANVAYHPYFLREGSVPTLEMQVLVPIQEQNEFAHNIVDIAAQISRQADYVAMSFAAYNRPLDAFVITRAIATFERSLLSGYSNYDQYIQYGDKSAMSDQAIRGMQLFFSDSVHCTQCHGGFNFTNYTFANNGLDTAYSDIGRMRFTGAATDNGLFKVPSLRNVAVTGPYMHDGSLQTLQQVVSHYNLGGLAHPNKSEVIQPLHLSIDQEHALVTFLESLTDSSFLQDPLYR
jgi:cytochrome c peroxidase